MVLHYVSFDAMMTSLVIPCFFPPSFYFSQVEIACDRESFGSKRVPVSSFILARQLWKESYVVICIFVLPSAGEGRDPWPATSVIYA